MSEKHLAQCVVNHDTWSKIKLLRKHDFINSYSDVVREGIIMRLLKFEYDGAFKYIAGKEAEKPKEVI